MAPTIHTNAVDAFTKKNMTGLKANADLFIELLADLEFVLATDARFMLGGWTEMAKAIGTTDEEKALYEYNARNQITLWGPNGDILDYAAKAWSGLYSAYYIPRWRLFFSTLEKNLAAGNTTFDDGAFRKEFLDTIGTPFTKDRKAFPTEPASGADPWLTACAVFKKWSSQLLLVL